MLLRIRDLTIALVLMAMGGLAHADPPLPSINTNLVFDVTNTVFAGGALGNGSSNSAAAIQSAINMASTSIVANATGGTVRIRAVGTFTNYISGPITMKNNVNLLVDTGTKLQMYPMVLWTNISTASTPFVSGNNLHDVEISGSGTIDGNSGFSSGSTSNWWGKSGSSNPEATRPQFLNINSTTNLLVEGVTLQNPPVSQFVFKSGDTNVTIQGVIINTVTNSPNTDSEFTCYNMVVRNCAITCGDDDLVTSGWNITVSNCTFHAGHGLSIGSYTTSGMSGLLVSNCAWNGTEYGIHMKSARGRGGLVQNLTYEDLTMTNVNFVIAIYSHYDWIGAPSHVINVSPYGASTDSIQSVNSTTPIWQNITISNLTAGTLGGNIAGIIWGLPEMAVSNVTISDVNIGDPAKTFCVYDARAIQFINSNLTAPNTTTNTFELYNAQVVISNSAPNPVAMTLDGLVIPPTNNVLALFNAQAAATSTNAFAPSPLLTLVGSKLTVSNSLNLGGPSVLNLGLGTNTTRIAVTGNLTLGGMVNVSDGGGLTNGTYTLFTYGGMLSYNGLTIGATPGTNFTYAISTNAIGQVNLVASLVAPPPLDPFLAWQLEYFGCTNVAVCPQAAGDADPLGKGMSNTNQFLAGLNPTNPASLFRITSVVNSGADVSVTWTTAGGHTNIMQVTGGDASGGYATNGFVDIPASVTILPGSGDVANNYLDGGAVTNGPSRYYRVRLVP
ncbi:MAG TPA: glycosyl hydrolase family 28 protein [Verrucomicrobiae bacterium]|nr:glycosyl hydrolase family 28 protein [Verrucomicrobiae bacterium]